jgi:hypothetical protein
MNPWGGLDQDKSAGYGGFGENLPGNIERKFDEFQCRAENGAVRG